MNRLYKMSRVEYKGLLKIASEQVPFGVYAVEKETTRNYGAISAKVLRNLKMLSDSLKHRDSKYMPMGGDG